MRRTLLFIISLILLTSFVSSDYNTDLRSVYMMENNSFIDEVRGYNGSEVGAGSSFTINNSGINNNYSYVRTTNKGIQVSRLMFDDYSVDSGHTLNFWVYPEKKEITYFMGWYVDSNNRGYIGTDANGNLNSWNRIGGVTNNCLADTGRIGYNDWNMISLVYNSSSDNVTYYINGSVVSMSAVVGTCDNSHYRVLANMGNVLFFNYGTSGTPQAETFDGGIDEIYFWNRTLIRSDVTGLWNGGIGFFVPFIPATPFFNITAHSNWSGNSITNFSALVVGIDGGEFNQKESDFISFGTPVGDCVNYTKLRDNNYSSYGYPIAGDDCIINLGYYKENYSSSMIWQVKDECGTANLTVPSACWDYYPSFVDLQVIADDVAKTIKWRCQNGTGRMLLRECAGAGNIEMYEEEVYFSLYAKNFNTTNGTINTGIPINLANLTNITIFDDYWFNATYINYNVSTDLNASLNQSIINFACFEKISNNTLSCVNSTIYPDADDYNFSIEVLGYFDVVQEETISVLDNETINVTGFYSTNLSLNSVAVLGSLSTCNYTVVSLNETYTEIVGGSPNTTIGLINGTYNITADCVGFAYNSSLIVINDTNETLTFNLYTTNSINITFKDIDTDSVLSGVNVTVQFIGATSQTNITDTGYLYVDLLVPDEYTIISNSDGYRQNTYIIDLSNRSTSTLTIYMTKTNDTSLVLISVQDIFSKDPISNAEITIQRYTTSWVTDQILKTDFNGQTEGYFVLSTVYYNFLVAVDGVTYFGIVNSNENKKNIYAEDVTNGIIIYIDTNPNTIIPNYQSTYDIVTNCKFTKTTNLTGYFVFSYDDTNNIQHDGSLNVYNKGVLNCTKSVTNVESASMNCPLTVTNNTGIFFFSAIGTLDGINIEQCYGSLGTDDVTNFNWGVAGWILGLLIIIIAFTSFSSMPSIGVPIGVIAFSLGMVVNLYLGNTGYAVIILLIFIAFLLTKTPSKGGVDT